MKRLLASAVVFLLVGCSTKNPESHFLDEVSSLSKEQVLARGDALAAKKRWDDARKYYSFLADSFPNDPLGRKAALQVADTFFAQRDTESLTEAQLRFKDFANRFPNDPSRAYALLMLGKCSFSQRKGPERDLTHVREATESLRQVLQLFPNSPYAAEAKALLARCLDDLSEHELGIAKYYINIKAWIGAKQRLDYLIVTYPETAAAKVAVELLDQVRVHLKAGEAPPPAPVTTKRSAEKH
jgi:outer membrane protein assembly factor BamD